MTETISADKKPSKLGLALTGVVGVMMILSSIGKFAKPAPIVANFASLHLSDYVTMIGAIELGSAVLFLVPRTASLGVLLVTGYFGGAIVAHLVQGSPAQSAPAIVLGALAWLGYGLRYPSLWASFTSKR
jgi:hypothetical protein